MFYKLQALKQITKHVKIWILLKIPCGVGPWWYHILDIYPEVGTGLEIPADIY